MTAKYPLELIAFSSNIPRSYLAMNNGTITRLMLRPSRSSLAVRMTTLHRGHAPTSQTNTPEHRNSLLSRHEIFNVLNIDICKI